MAVYVDELVECVPRKRFPFRKQCRMFADEGRELGRMASALGLRITWGRGRTFRWYYLTPGKRRQALLNGAVEVDRGAFGRVKRDWLMRKVSACVG